MTPRDDGPVNDEPQLPSLRSHFYRRDPRSVSAARAFTRAALLDWDLKSLLDDATVCVSELTTNALLHGVPPGRGFRLTLTLGAATLRIAVDDSGPGVPVATAPAPDHPSGRGLLLTAALAARWGVSPRDPGKTVWCEFALGDRRRTDESEAPRTLCR
ncbi:ATP-binding protein [Streptomyces sp. NPDC060194]|uniref:ATP-binding protein n=1 Tax=Streptomyces sp. NPDC060194 TaxID=3347069 RepID=UPI00364A7CA4